MTATQMTPRFVRQRITAAVRDTLAVEATRRKTRTVDEWITAEREAVAKTANATAAAYGYPPAMTAARVEHLEVTCVGHFDYAAKLALLVAEDLVLEDATPRR